MSNMSKKKKVKRRSILSSARPELVIGQRGTGGETKGEDVLQMMKKDIAYQEVRNNKEEVKKEPKKEPKKEVKEEVKKEVKKEIRSEGEAHNEVAPHVEVSAVSYEEEVAVHPAEVQKEDELKIRGTRIADSLLMQLEDEVIGFINRRLEEHVARRIKGLLVPVAKLSLKVQRTRKKLTSDEGAKGDEAASHLLDLEDDLDYILESSKLKRISPQVGERFNPNLHEEVDFSWKPDHEESEILATLRDGFFWEYNQEMIVKPQVVVNRRLSA